MIRAVLVALSLMWALSAHGKVLYTGSSTPGGAFTASGLRTVTASVARGLAPRLIHLARSPPYRLGSRVPMMRSTMYFSAASAT